jgi:hypothetical protein
VTKTIIIIMVILFLLVYLATLPIASRGKLEETWNEGAVAFFNVMAQRVLKVLRKTMKTYQNTWFPALVLNPALTKTKQECSSLEKLRLV